MFGVTEPAIYGITLQRLPMFIISCIGGALSGAYAAFAGLKYQQMAGMGIFEMPNTPEIIAGKHKDFNFFCLVFKNIASTTAVWENATNACKERIGSGCPVANTVAGWLSDGILNIYSISPVLAGIVFGGLLQVFVVFGVHITFIVLAIMNLATGPIIIYPNIVLIKITIIGVKNDLITSGMNLFSILSIGAATATVRITGKTVDV